jgi:hypothetical protein
MGANLFVVSVAEEFDEDLVLTGDPTHVLQFDQWRDVEASEHLGPLADKICQVQFFTWFYQF